MTLTWRGDQIAAQLAGAARRSLLAGAEHLLEESNRKVPLETGALAQSGVAIASGDEAAVGYTSVYAARQHEELGWQHDPGREAKYLENALTNNAQAILDVIADEIRGLF